LLADNCGSLTDCYGTQMAAAVVIGAIALGIAAVWAWPIFLNMLTAQGAAAVALGSQEMLLVRHFMMRGAAVLAAEAEQGLALEAMAGVGTKVAIRDLPRLLSQYGGAAGDFAKMTTRSIEIIPGRTIQMHFYKNISTGEIFDLKIKPAQLKSAKEVLEQVVNSVKRMFS